MWIRKRTLLKIREQVRSEEWADCQRMLLQVGFIDRIVNPDYAVIRTISETLLKEGHSIQITPRSDGQYELIDLESHGRLDELMQNAVETASKETIKNILLNQNHFGLDFDVPPRSR